MIKPISKSIISTVVKLHTAKHRNEEGFFIAEGEKVVSELLNSEFRIKLVACTTDFFNKNADVLTDREVSIVTETELSKISLLQTPNQVLAVAEQPKPWQTSFEKRGIYLMLDGIRDPGNMGTIIRTAEWFGVNAIICSDDCVDVFNPKVVQGTMGSLFRMDISYGNLTSLADQAKKEGIDKLFGAVLGGEKLERDIQKDETILLVIGGESHGITPEMREKLTHSISIPGAQGSKTESLNAAVAAGILLFAFLK